MTTAPWIATYRRAWEGLPEGYLSKKKRHLVSHNLEPERLFDALPEVVFGEFTGLQAQKELYAYAPDWIVESECDLRVGGWWTNVFGPPRTPLARDTNVFQVADWPRRLVYRSTMTMPDGSGVDTGMEVTFREQNARTQMTIVQDGFPAAGVRDEFAPGWASILDRLGRAVAARVADC